jgi:hypothetical protein
MKTFITLFLAWIAAAFVVIGSTESVPAVQHGKVTVAVPDRVVRVTVPVNPPVTFNRSSCPFGFEISGGTIVPAQWEPVVFAPDGRVRVVELLAILPKAVSYSVVPCSLRPAGPAQPGPWARSIAGSGLTLDVDGLTQALEWRQHPTKNGSTWITREFYGDHVFGWAHFIAGEDVVLVDLVLHNGAPGSDVWTFGAVDIGPGTVTSVLPEPRVAGSRLLTCGWMPQRTRREFRLALTKDATGIARARELLSGAGWGVSDQWTQVEAYGPQQMRLADLSHLTAKVGTQTVFGVEALRATLRGQWNGASQAVLNGWTWGIGTTYGQPGGTIGDYPVWGVAYGGVTGGGGIDQWRGMELALSGEPTGLLFYQLEHLAITSRHRIGLYSDTGNPIDPKSRGWRPDIVDGGRWVKGTPNPFPVPSRTTPLDGYAPLDWQHGARRASGSIVLAWLANDLLAQRELALNGWLWMRAFEGRAAGIVAMGKANPSHGSELGRAHGWGNHIVAAAYATGAGGSNRVAWEVFAAVVAEAYERTQMPNGVWQAAIDTKFSRDAPYNNQHAVQQTIELGIGANGLMGLRGSFGLAVEQQVIRAAREGVSKYLWTGPVLGGGTWQFAAVRPYPYSSTPYSTIPTGMHSAGQDSWQIGSTLAYWHLLDPSPSSSLAIRRYCQGAADPLAWLRKQNFNNLTNREPMLLAMQP